MKTRKMLCLLLIALLTVSFSATRVAAGSNCKDGACAMAAGLRADHHHAATTKLTADCCARHRQAPCELQRRQVVELAALSVSAGRFASFQTAVFSPALARFDSDPESSVRIRGSTVGIAARSAPIYLTNMTLLC